jgi:hypothetical protein
VGGIGIHERASLLHRILRRLAGSSGHFRQSADFDEAGRQNLRVAPDVGASAHEDGLTILHIPTGRVFLCNRTGSRIWQGVVQGLSADAISREISREVGVALELVERHTSSFLRELERRGLVTRRMDGWMMNRLTYALLVTRALWELGRYDLTHATLGFQRIHRQMAGKRVAGRVFQAEAEALICEAVCLATCFYYKPVHCLQRSVVAARLLRRCGIDGQLVIGYRPAPFFSHAWVEVNGRVVNDSPAYKEQLHVLCTF